MYSINNDYKLFQAVNKLDGCSYAIKKIKFETDEALDWFKVFAVDSNRSSSSSMFE